MKSNILTQIISGILSLFVSLTIIGKAEAIEWRADGKISDTTITVDTDVQCVGNPITFTGSGSDTDEWSEGIGSPPWEWHPKDYGPDELDYSWAITPGEEDIDWTVTEKNQRIIEFVGLTPDVYTITLTVDDPRTGSPDDEAVTVTKEVTIVKVDLELNNMSSTVGTPEVMDEAEEEEHGAEIRINADFDEKNKNAAGKPIEDFRPDAKVGHQIDENDPDLLSGILKIESGSVKGKWKLIFPTKVKVWKQMKNKWEEVTSNTLSDEVSLPLNLPLRVEGIDGSILTKDVEIKAEFIPAGATIPCFDKVLLTVVKIEFMLTFDDGPFKNKTMKVVKGLRKFYVDGKEVKTAFFQVGEDGSDAPWWDPYKGAIEGVDDNPQVTRDVDSAGHSVGNHTHHHEHFGDSSKQDVKDEITACENEIQTALGKTPEKKFRPPYFVDTQNVRDGVSELSYHAENRPIIWGKAGFGDTTGGSASDIAEATINYLKQWNTKEDPDRREKPAIICYHEYHWTVYHLIGWILEHIRDKGFILVNFDQNRCDANKSYYE